MAVALGGGDLGNEFPEGGSEVEVWADGFERLCIEVRHVDCVANLAGLEEVFDLDGNFDADVFLGFCGGGAEVWGEDGFLSREEWEICWWWLDFVNIESDAREVAGIDGRFCSCFIDESAASAVYDECAGVHECDGFLVEDVFALRCHRNV